MSREPEPTDWDPDLANDYKEARECHCCGYTFIIDELVDENLCITCWAEFHISKAGDEN